MKPNQWSLAAERSDDQGNMFLSVVRCPECNDLGVGHVLKRQLGTGDDLNRRLPALAHDFRDRNGNVGHLRIQHPQCWQKPCRAGEVESRAAGLDTFVCHGMKRADRSAIEVSTRVRNR